MLKGSSLRDFAFKTLLAGALAAVPTGAFGEGYPPLSGEIAIEIQDDWTYDSDDPDSELNDLFTTTEPTLVVHFQENLSLTVHGVLEPVRDPDPGDDRAFEDHGLYVQDLYLQYERDRYSLMGGKFTPNFGIAWDAAPGIYGTDIAGDYEIAERIGFGGSFDLGNEGNGAHTVSASVFFLDTTVLSESTFTNRGRTRLSDGGPSNTEDLTSFAVALDGEEIPALIGLSYHVAVVRLAEGQGNDADEIGYVVALSHSLPLGEDLEINPLVEYAHFQGAGGTDGLDKDYLTTGVEVAWKSWNLALSYTWRRSDLVGQTSDDDHQFQASAGYAFPFGVGLNVGGKIVEESGVTSAVVGFLIDYKFEF